MIDFWGLIVYHYVGLAQLLGDLPRGLHALEEWTAFDYYFVKSEFIFLQVRSQKFTSCFGLLHAVGRQSWVAFIWVKESVFLVVLRELINGGFFSMAYDGCEVLLFRAFVWIQVDGQYLLFQFNHFLFFGYWRGPTFWYFDLNFNGCWCFYYFFLLRLLPLPHFSNFLNQRLPSFIGPKFLNPCRFPFASAKPILDIVFLILMIIIDLLFSCSTNDSHLLYRIIIVIALHILAILATSALPHQPGRKVFLRILRGLRCLPNILSLIVHLGGQPSSSLSKCRRLCVFRLRVCFDIIWIIWEGFDRERAQYIWSLSHVLLNLYILIKLYNI